MRRIVSTRRFAAASLTALVVCASAWILLRPRPAQAFTLVPNAIIFDPISVTGGQTLHLHLVNQASSVTYSVFTNCKPTTPVGDLIFAPAAALPPGAGIDQSYPFTMFVPTPGTTRMAVVCAIGLVDATGAKLADDFSGRLASSIEIIDDGTGRPTEFNASRHIMLMKGGNATPCLFCN